MAEKGNRPDRGEYGYLCPVDSRWSDNDIYGHINNVVYYSYFDSTINRYLIEQGGLDIHGGQHIAYVVSSGCDYLEAAAYPESLVVGMKVDKLGVHVFVNRESGRPVSIPEPLRAALDKLI